MTEQYPADITPKPVGAWSTEKLTAGYTAAPIVLQKIDGTNFSTAFTGDTLPAGYASFISGEPYGKVVQVNNQMFPGIGTWVAGGGAIPPRMRADIKIGASPAMVFQGGTDNGNIWGLDIQAPLQSLLVTGDNITVMAVLRATTSAFRCQGSTPGLADGGTILSLDADIPFAAPGDTIAGVPTITNVSPYAGIKVGMRVDGPSFITGDRFVLSIVPTGPTTATITLFGGAPSFTIAGSLIFFSHTTLRIYQSGDSSPGSFAMTNDGVTGSDITLRPTDFSGCEIRPVVCAWTSNTIFPGGNVFGQQSYMNEIVRSRPGLSLRADPIIIGFVGRMGNSQVGGFNKCGDFYLAALMIWNKPLTQAQRTIVADSLYRRFQINEHRSIRTAKSVSIIGDSIAMDYTTFANYGWSKRLADKFPDSVRFMNWAVPGSQITISPTTADYGPTESFFNIAVAGQMNYSKVGKNVLIIFGGGNDMTDSQNYKYTLDIASNVVSVFNDAMTLAATTVGSNVLTFGAFGSANALPRWLSVGALVENRTTPGSIPAGRTITALTDTTVTLSGPVAAPGVGIGDTIRFRYHNMVANQRLQFTSFPLDGGGNPLPTGISIGVVYYVKTVTAVDKFTISATPGGAVIDIGGSFVGEHGLLEYTKTATGIFGTPTTGGLQKIVHDAAAAGASKIYMLTVLKRTGSQYNFIREELNALIMGGGAGGYTPLDLDTDPVLTNNDTGAEPGTAGPAYPDGTHLNEAGSDALANFVYTPLNTYLNS